MASALLNVGIALLALAGAVLGAGAIWFTSLSYRLQSALQRTTALTGPRVAAYQRIVKEFRAYSDESGEPVDIPFAERSILAAQMQDWYFEQGGWLMDGDTFNSYRAARRALLNKDADAASVFNALSSLRTEMKIELGVREPPERDKPFAPSEERGFRR
jgi:hypothetical protein